MSEVLLRLLAGRLPGASLDVGDSPDAPRGEWAEAACRGMGPDIFFPERGMPTREAKAVCAGCPVRAACLRAALEERERFGIWGGFSERERRRLRRRVNQGADIDAVIEETLRHHRAA